MTIMYGIANCDTIKKAKKWFASNSIDFEFHDYKKQPPNATVLVAAIEQYGIDKVMNKRGTTYRKLSDAEKSGINENNVVALLNEYPSMIKRPLLVHNEHILLGFDESNYKEFFNID